MRRKLITLISRCSTLIRDNNKSTRIMVREIFEPVLRAAFDGVKCLLNCGSAPFNLRNGSEINYYRYDGCNLKDYDNYGNGAF